MLAPNEEQMFTKTRSSRVDAMALVFSASHGCGIPVHRARRRVAFEDHSTPRASRASRALCHVNLLHNACLPAALPASSGIILTPISDHLRTSVNMSLITISSIRSAHESLRPDWGTVNITYYFS